MGYTSTEHQLQRVDDPPPDQVTVASGSWIEVCCGALGLALAVVGVLGNNPPLMGAIAAGLAAMVLAFVAFAAIAPMTLALVADACVGGGLVLAGGGTLTTLRGVSNGASRKE